MYVEPKTGQSLPPYESCQMLTTKGPKLPNEEMVLDFEPGIDNFFTKVRVYADENISNDELIHLYASIQEAGEFVADMQVEKFQLNPLYNELEIFYRPACINADDMGKETTLIAGYKTDHGYIVLIPPYLNCDYKEPLVGGELVSMLVHELGHTYFMPKFHADPANILEEGLTTYAQRLFASQNGQGYYNTTSDNPQYEMTEEFPEKPHKPAMEIDAYAGAEAEVAGADGHNHFLKVEKIIDHSDEGKKDFFDVTFDGQSLGVLKDGRCNKVSGDLLVCASESGEEHKLLIFSLDAEIERVASIDHFDTPSVIPTTVDYEKIKYIYSENGFGKKQVFERTTGLMNSLQYEFDQTAYTLSAVNYQAAFLLHTKLERLFWEQHSETDPEFHPDDYFKKMGELHRNYVDYVFSNYIDKTPSEGCETGETNIYHSLCNTLELPLDECLGIFKSFGLDAEFGTCGIEWQGVGVGISCGYAAEEDEIFDHTGEDEGNSGCSMSLY